MRKTLRIASREYTAAVRTKGFIIGLALAPIVMSGSIIAGMIIGDRADTTDKKIAVIDRSGVVAQAVLEAAETRNAQETHNEITGKKIRPAYLVEILEPNEKNPETQRLELSEQVRNDQLYAFVEIGPDVLHPREDAATSRIVYYAKNAVMDRIPNWMCQPVNKHLRRLRMTEEGVDDSAVGDVLRWLDVEKMGLVSMDTETGTIQDARKTSKGEALGLPIGMMLLMSLLVFMGGGAMLSSVMEEKSQRIAEVLLGSVKPFQFMMGKVLGGAGVSLTGSAVYVVGGILAVSYMGLTEYIPFRVLPWFFAYLLAAVVMLGSIFAALGSACNDAKDAQNLTFPAMLPMMIPMFVLVPVAKEPLAGFATWLSLFPVFTPTLMMVRMCTPVAIPMWQPWAGLIGVLMFTVFIVWAGGRVFRVGILMQGKPPRIGDILRWALRG